ncbi:hypothetical protein ACLOJK_005845 [Asimina triloba]
MIRRWTPQRRFHNSSWARLKLTRTRSRFRCWPTERSEDAPRWELPMFHAKSAAAGLPYSAASGDFLCRRAATIQRRGGIYRTRYKLRRRHIGIYSKIRIRPSSSSPHLFLPTTTPTRITQREN